MIYQPNYALRSPQYIPIIPFTAQELKSMFGWTVEEALRKGYPVVSWDIPRELRRQKKAASEVGASLAVKTNITVR